MRSGKLLEWCCFYDFNNSINVNQKLYIKMRTADRSPSKEFEQIVVAWKSPIVRKMNAFLIRKKNWEKFQLNCLGSLRSNDNRWCEKKNNFHKIHAKRMVCESMYAFRFEKNYTLSFGLICVRTAHSYTPKIPTECSTCRCLFLFCLFLHSNHWFCSLLRFYIEIITLTPNW